MPRQFSTLWGRLADRSVALVVLGALALSGCAADDEGITMDRSGTGFGPPPPAAPEAEMAAVQERPAAVADQDTLTAEPQVEGDNLIYSTALPTGERDTSVLLVSMIAPRQVRVGEPYEYTLRATNLTEAPLSNVRVYQADPGARVAAVGATTQPAAQGQQAGWQIGLLPAGQTVTQQFSAVADEEGTRQVCLAANYEPTLCAAVTVVNPELRITKEGPTDVLLCEPLTYRYAVTNVGTGVAQNVRIVEELPQGLTTGDGQTTVEIPVGELPAGQTEDFTVALRPAATGQYTSRAGAISESGRVMSRPVTTLVQQPNLELQIEGPEWSYVGTPITYQVTVANVGSAPARDATVVLDAEGFVDEEETRELEVIPAGEARQITVTLEGEQAGPARLLAKANAYCADEVRQTVSTEIRTIPALLLETVDNNDPVQIGQTTTYQVVVKNQGSGVANNVTVNATLPEGMSFVEAQGATDVQADGQALTFAPIPQLPPGEVAAWEVVARAEQPGWKQFRLQLKSDEMRQPANEQEPTRLYQP